MRVQLQPSYVLHRRDYRDSSHLLEVITADHGRVALVSKGSRRQVKGRSTGSILQPFIPLLLSFSGRGELKTLTGREAAGPVNTLLGDRLYCGMYLNELMVRLLHRNDAHPGLFIAYGDAVASLASHRPIEDILRRFESNLLEELGYSFDLKVDGFNGEAVRPDAWYSFHAQYGLIEARSNGEFDGERYPGEDLLSIARGEVSGSVSTTYKRLLREVLSSHLGDKPLKSRDLFRLGTAASGPGS